jgi:hypothetical protein
MLTIGTKREHYPEPPQRGQAGVSSNPHPEPDPDGLEAATDQAIATCGGDARGAVKALIVANEFLEVQVEQLKADVSSGYARGYYHGRFKTYTG